MVRLTDHPDMTLDVYHGHKTITQHQLNMKFCLLINVKMPTIVGILTFISRKNSILSISDPELKLNFLIFFVIVSS